MKLKKLLALTLTGAMLTATLTACTPLDAAEIMYDAIFGGGGSSSTGSNNSGNNGSTGGSTVEDAENVAVAKAYVRLLQSNTVTSQAYADINPIYDIPHLEDFVKKIDEYCTEKCETNGMTWEETVHELSADELNKLATVLEGEKYPKSTASIRFGKVVSGTPEEQAKSFTRICVSFWYSQQAPYNGDAWFDSVVLTRADGSQYRFLLSICHS